MRIKLDARSWLLIATAGWALACVIVALGGFGGHYRLLADNPSLAPPLPPLPHTNSATALGPLNLYAAAADRPLFYPDRKRIAVHVPGKKSDAKPLDAILTSVLITPAVQMVILQDNQTKKSIRAREGEQLGGSYSNWTLVAMTPRSAVFDGGSLGKTTLDLRIFNGQGGEPPTRMGLTPQVVASGALGTQTQPGNVPPPPPPPPDDNQQADAPDNANDAANAAASMAANDAAQQAEQIRRRIEERRRQAQAEAPDASPANDKDQ